MDRSLRAPIGPLVVLYNIYKLGHRHGRRTGNGPRPLFLDVRDFRRRRCGIVRRPHLHRSLPHIVLPYPCLLYTSPSPRDATLSRMPSSA